jgi:excisionase family DNA binding protein
MTVATFTGEVFTTPEAAEYLGFAEDTVRRYIYRGLIKAKKVGQQWLVTKEECNRYLAEKNPPGNPNFRAEKNS